MEHPHGAYGYLHWMVFHLSAPKVHINVEWVKQKTPRVWGCISSLQFAQNQPQPLKQ